VCESPPDTVTEIALAFGTIPTNTPTLTIAVTL
jgi:hypothetical protein